MARAFAKGFYDSPQWKKCRDSFMESKHFTCERCSHRAYIAHHKKHVTPDNINNPNVTLNWDNLQALCYKCHKEVHGNGTGLQDGMRFNEKGELVKG